MKETDAIILCIISILVFIASISILLSKRKPEKSTSTYATESEPTQEKKSHKLRNTIIVLSTLFCVGLGGYLFLDKYAKDNEIPNPIVTITKQAPTITANQTLTGIDITITANANYDEVTIKLEIYNSSDVIIGSYTLKGTGYLKGNKYQLSQSLTFNELLNGSYYSCKITSYK